MGEDAYDLLKSDARKPGEEFVDGRASFEVLKKCSNWHASATKNPSTTKFVFRCVLHVDKRPSLTCST